MSDRLLVVDDEPMNVDMLSRRLIRAGYEVLTAPGGPEALELLRTEEIDLVLLDVMMPGMSGIEVLQHLRQRHASHVLPVIMVSAAAESPMIVQAIEEGANDYVTKPVDMPVLLARIETHMAQKREHAELTAPLRGRLEQLGPYKILEELGKGGMGTVYRALDTRLERDVAVKVLSPEVASDAKRLERFRQEARALASFRHAGIVEIYDLSLEPPPYFAMELVDGRNLEVYLEGKPLAPGWATGLIVRIAEALAAVHAAGIYHRDLKPSNIMIDSKNGIRLMDFGLVRFSASDLQLTRPGEMVGTPCYMAPEQIAGGAVDQRTDLYSLGVILYEMLHGDVPYSSRSLGVLLREILEKPAPPLSGVPDEVAALCLSMLAKQPDQRPSSAKEVAERLKPFAR